MKKIVRSLPLLALFLLALTVFPACGEEDNDNQPDDQAKVDDVVTDDVVVDELVADVDTAEPLPTYPEETPTSNQVDDIAANVTFYDQDDVMWTLGHFYKKKKLIWLIFSAYDCPYCNVEKSDLPAIYKQEYKDKGLEIIFIENGLLSGPQPSKEPAKLRALRESMIEGYGDGAKFVWGYLKSDMQATMGKYIKQGYPTNALIDATSMKILNYFEGWDSSLSDNQEKAIIFWLSEL